MSEPPFTMRPALPEDAAALAELAERCFCQTFAAANTPQNMDMHCARFYGEAMQAEEIADSELLTLLADCAGALIGFAQLRLATPPPFEVAALRPAELQRLYVDQSRHGRGVAQALLQAGLAAVTGRGCDLCWLGVWEHNPRAIAFYRKFGFATAGEHVFLLGEDPQRDLIMLRSLCADGAST